MSSIRCTLKTCAYRNRKGYCTRKTIMLQVTENDCNELYCLGWSTPEQRLFNRIMTGDETPVGGKDYYKALREDQGDILDM